FTVTRASGHGVYVPEFSNGLFRNLRILDNRAVEFNGLGHFDMGAGMFVVDCSPTIFRCRYVDNYLLPTGGAQGGGAGLGIHAATAWVEGCSFSGNVTEALPFVSVEGGGALQARKSSLTLLHSEFRENSCIEGRGGAVALISCDS